MLVSECESCVCVKLTLKYWCSNSLFSVFRLEMSSSNMTRSWKRGLGTDGSSSSGKGAHVVVDCAGPAGLLAGLDSGGVYGMHVSYVGVCVQMGVTGGREGSGWSGKEVRKRQKLKMAAKKIKTDSQRHDLTSHGHKGSKDMRCIYENDQSGPLLPMHNYFSTSFPSPHVVCFGGG